MEMEVQEESDKIICSTYFEVNEILKKLEEFALTKESDFLSDILQIENKFSKIQLLRMQNRKEKTIVNYFKPI
jgi:hypothetical protein